MNGTTSSERPRRPRNVVGLGVAVALFGWLFWSMLRSTTDYEAVMCDEDIASSAVDVVMLSASWCGYCRRARAYLQDKQISHCEFDVEQSEEGRRRFAGMSVKVVPMIEVGKDTLVGYSRTELEQSLLAQDLMDPAHADW